MARYEKLQATDIEEAGHTEDALRGGKEGANIRHTAPALLLFVSLLLNALLLLKLMAAPSYETPPQGRHGA